LWRETVDARKQRPQRAYEIDNRVRFGGR
jgi:hypothetical protein